MKATCRLVGVLVAVGLLLASQRFYPAGAPAGNLAFAQKDEPSQPSEKREPAPRTDPPVVHAIVTEEGESNEAQIEKALAKPVDIHFLEMTLEDTLIFVRDQHHVQIWIDRGAIQEEGNVKLDAPVTLLLNGVRLESALNLILEPVGLDWYVEDEVIKVSTHGRVASICETRAFPVVRLLEAGHDVDDLKAAVLLCLGETALGKVVATGNTLVVRQPQRGQAKVAQLLNELESLADEEDDDSHKGPTPAVVLKAYPVPGYSSEELASTIMRLIEPAAWHGAREGAKASASSIKGAVIVQAGPQIQKKVARLIEQLRSAGVAGVSSPTDHADDDDGDDEAEKPDR
jgi:hypothetical protein